MKVIKAPGELPWTHAPAVFLAGSIEMGKAVDWQTQMTNDLADMNVLVLNPRRDDWDSSWEQKMENAQFRQQVEWELQALEHCQVIAMYFDPKTMSPISLLELGLFAGQRSIMGSGQESKLIVCCPEGFWRKGNVDIVCNKYKIQQVNTLAELTEAVRQRLK